ncbi:hypothetical protein M7I_3071 [Glarea lozoyensis 74030]|uniref:Uncharacterized protein n=1 Tax=Glarea lozoyensis (strain ATCC 74030 / MF5533) TaxID=1104152 RepID=H0EKH3_GLAL7|nr:hypothetical protein M7I_3071 [Glarea lozoyensis 74030]
MSNTVELCDRTPDIEAQRASHATQGGTASVEPARRSDIDDSQKVLDQFSQIVSTTTVSLMSDFENTQKRLGVLLFLDYDRNTQEINRVYSTLLTSRVPPSSRTDIGIATELYYKIDDLSMETLRAVLDLNRHETEEFATAYAAVLVVFVGASIDSEDTGNKVD